MCLLLFRSLSTIVLTSSRDFFIELRGFSLIESAMGTSLAAAVDVVGVELVRLEDGSLWRV